MRIICVFRRTFRIRRIHYRQVHAVPVRNYAWPVPTKPFQTVQFPNKNCAMSDDVDPFDEFAACQDFVASYVLDHDAQTVDEQAELERESFASEDSSQRTDSPHGMFHHLFCFQSATFHCSILFHRFNTHKAHERRNPNREEPTKERCQQTQAGPHRVAA